VSVAGTNRTETGVHHWHIYPDPAEAATACAEYLAQRIAAVLETRELCHVALPGGSTPAACLSRLAEQPLPWSRVHWYLGDERCLPPGDAGRNDRMIEQQLWRIIQAPAANIHPIPAELGAEAAARRYSELIDALDRLDIVLLGMGEDGHTASLFPDNPALDDPGSVVPVHHAPKPPPERVSLGITTLRTAAERVVLATGPGKRNAINQVKAGAALPVNRIGPLLWFADRAAVD
jgi:6-phosphogluconolactonase